MNYSIIIPLYNEEENIFNLHKELTNILKEHINDNKFEIIYVDDGSQDNTFMELSKLEGTEIPIVRIKHRKNVAQSYAIQSGSNFSKYENLIFMDGDLQNDPKDLPKLLKEYEKGFDLTIGWRKHRKDPFITKTLPSIIANFLVRIFTNSKIHDHGCALKVLKKEVFLQVTEFGADFHRLFAARAADLGYKISEIEVNHRERIHGKSKYGFSRIIKVLMDIIYLGFLKNKSKSLYYFGVLGFGSIFLSLLSFLLMLYFKYFVSGSFILTPLPTLVVFFLMAGLNFILIGVVVQIFITSSNKKDQKGEIKSSSDNNIKTVIDNRTK